MFIEFCWQLLSLFISFNVNFKIQVNMYCHIAINTNHVNWSNSSWSNGTYELAIEFTCRYWSCALLIECRKCFVLAGLVGTRAMPTVYFCVPHCCVLLPSHMNWCTRLYVACCEIRRLHVKLVMMYTDVQYSLCRLCLLRISPVFNFGFVIPQGRAPWRVGDSEKCQRRPLAPGSRQTECIISGGSGENSGERTGWGKPKASWCVVYYLSPKAGTEIKLMEPKVDDIEPCTASLPTVQCMPKSLGAQMGE